MIHTVINLQVPFFCIKVYGTVSSKIELVHKKLRQDAHRKKWEVYDWTDETDQMILIIQSLTANRGQVCCLQNQSHLIN